MNVSPAQDGRSESFFLDVAAGRRYCLLHTPAATPHAAVVYLHPFGDEMNKARRMAALQARAFARAGLAVLQIDLHGCGDSSGAFVDARWRQWQDDAVAAMAHLQERFGVPVCLWGLRLGALLALDVATTAAGRPAAAPVAGLLLWQPVLNGATFLTQFLRLRSAGAMLTGEADGGTRVTRGLLAAGSSVEVAGYLLSPALAADLDGLDAAALAPPCPVQWFELGADASRTAGAASVRLAAGWGAATEPTIVVGPAFWQTQEIETAPNLLDASVAALRTITGAAGHA